VPPFFWTVSEKRWTTGENITQPLSGSGRTYRDKVDNTVVVGNILMNVHGEWGAHHGLQKEAMFHDVRVRALLSLLVLLVLLNAGVSRMSWCHGSWRGDGGKGESPVTESPLSGGL
jgi:hypothetical protein